MGRPIRLLVVEDAEDDAILLLHEMRRAGFEPDATVVDTRDALIEAIDAQQWDIVISDYAMPGFNGLAALRIVQETGRDLPFIIVSGTIGEHVAVEAMRAGAHDYLMKGRLARLGPAVDRELREAEERRARRLAEEAYRSLVDGSLQGFIILQEGSVVFANQAFAEILGYAVDEFESMNREEVIELVHPEDRQMVWSRYRDRLEGRPVPARYIFRMTRKTGEVCWVEVFAKSITYGGSPATQAAVVDVSERVLHEREQRAIATVATSLRTAENRMELVALLLDQVLQLLNADGVGLAMRDPATGGVEIEMTNGVWQDLAGTRIAAGEGLTGTIISTGMPYSSNDVTRDPRLARAELGAATKAVAGVPLIAADQTIGVLWMGRRSEISSDDLVLLTALGEMTASAVRRIALHEELTQSNAELTQAYDSTLEGWAMALELRDGDTQVHTSRVAELTLHMGRAVGLEGDDLVDLRRGALLHDIGKMAVPDHILRKPGALDAEEWEIMKQHPGHAHEMLSNISYLRRALDIPYCHHERWDGTGYPRGLSAEEIPLAARIFAVVDVWDAVRSDRPYRSAWSEEKAIKHIRDGAGSHFDPDLVGVFLDTILEFRLTGA